jgi:hypothetical protein
MQNLAASSSEWRSERALSAPDSKQRRAIPQTVMPPRIDAAPRADQFTRGAVEQTLTPSSAATNRASQPSTDEGPKSSSAECHPSTPASTSTLREIRRLQMFEMFGSPGWILTKVYGTVLWNVSYEP